MHNNKALIEYWNCGLQQQALMAVTAEQIISLGQSISLQECQQGCLAPNNTINSWMPAEGSTPMVIAPVMAKPSGAKNHQNYFFPLLLVIDLDANNVITPHVRHSLPIIPQSVLEPASLAPLLLGTLEDFENHLVMQPPVWLEEPSLLSWQRQYGYALEMLDAVNGGVWRKHLQELNYTLQDAAMIFPLSAIVKPVNMSVKLLSKRNKIKLIDAQHNSGKSDYAKELIVEAWLEAALKQSAPPQHVWFEHGKPPKYANIFSLLEAPMPHGLSGSMSSASLHAELLDNFNAYSKGKQVVSNWKKVVAQLHQQYSDKGGVYARVTALQNNLKEARAHNRHMQVLYSIWLRHLERLANWTKLFNFVPFVEQTRLRKLHNFFAQNFPSEKIQGKSQKQLEDIVLDKMRRVANSERFIADALHQVENDLRQETLIQDVCIQWARSQSNELVDFNNVDEILNKARAKMLKSLLAYWQADFLLRNGYEDFVNRTPDAIDMLIVEHAEYVSPMQAATLLAQSKQAVIMGNYQAICQPRFSTQADYELCKQFGLVSCDADFEDLQFDGVLASLGNMWNLCTQGEEADLTFTNRDTVPLQYEFKNILAVSEPYFGSRLNLAEVNAIYNWLLQNPQACNQIAIYTTFGAQLQHIRDRLQATPFADIPVRLVQEPCFDVREIALFSPVYTTGDPGPYIFDRGTEILENLKANAKKRLIVIGDVSIFKPELHSASGKFAALLFAKLLYNTKNEEVYSV